jgi:hypothetical protein
MESVRQSPRRQDISRASGPVLIQAPMPRKPGLEESEGFSEPYSHNKSVPFVWGELVGTAIADAPAPKATSITGRTKLSNKRKRPGRPPLGWKAIIRRHTLAGKAAGGLAMTAPSATANLDLPRIALPVKDGPCLEQKSVKPSLDCLPAALRRDKRCAQRQSVEDRVAEGPYADQQGLAMHSLPAEADVPGGWGARLKGQRWCSTKRGSGAHSSTGSAKGVRLHRAAARQGDADECLAAQMLLQLSGTPV